MPGSATETGRRVFVRDLELSMKIGAYAHEARGRQRVVVNLALEIAAPARAIDDRLDRVVCYDDLIERVRAIANAGHINLVETFAERICAACLAIPAVTSVSATVEKPDARKDAGSVGVTLTAARR